MKNFQHIGVGPAEFTFQREFQICPFLGIDPCLLGYQLINIQKSHFPVPAEKPVLLSGFLFRLKPDLGKIHNIQPLSHQHKKIRRGRKRPKQQGIENIKGDHIIGHQAFCEIHGRNPVGSLGFRAFFKETSAVFLCEFFSWSFQL